MADLLSRFLLFIGLYVVLALVSCSSKPEKLVSSEDDVGADGTGMSSAELVQELRDVRYTQSKGDRLQWELVAKSVEQAVDGPTNLQKVKITYYSDDGRITVLTADSGMYEDATRNAVLQGNVVVNTSDGNRLVTDVLRWNQQTETLEGEGRVTMTRGDSLIKGKGFQLLPEVESFRIYSVEGIIHQEDMNL